MSDINTVRRERKAVLKAAYQALRPVDTQIELLQRYLTRLLGRAKQIPTATEFNAILENSQRLDDAFDDFVKVLRAGLRIFMRMR